MKRCPQCNRVESDDALVYCRVDGTTLVGDSDSVSSEVETSILPHTTDASASRSTVPTTALPPAQPPSTTCQLTKPKRRRFLIALAIVIVLAIPAAVIVSVLTYNRFSQTRSNAIESIVVLPFQNVSNDPNVEYLSDGIAESLINSLTELQQLKVIARATAFRFKGKDIDPQQVGRQLNVRAVLMGRVRQTRDSLSVQVDLVDATTGAQLWGKEYERKASDILSVKQAITREVTENLRLRLSGEQQQQLTRRDTTNAEAYQFYLRGRYYWNKRTADGLEKAINEFQQAIDRDPNYALGYVGLADCYLLLEDYADVPANEALPKARAAVERALQIDETLAEAHTSLASVYEESWNWKKSEEEYKRAISLNPNYPTARHWYSIHLKVTGRLDDALTEIKRAQELDPLSVIINHNVAVTYLVKNDLDLAIEQFKKAIELDPSFPAVHQYLGFAYLKQRRYDDAVAEFQKAVELSRGLSRMLGGLGYCYAVTGRRAEASKILKELEEKYNNRESTAVPLAVLYAGLGDKNQAFAWLEKAVQQRTGDVYDITWFSAFDDLRSDPRYTDLVRRMGLQP